MQASALQHCLVSVTRVYQQGRCMTGELDKFYALIDQIEIAMMTTRRRDGHLESRAMANQKRAAGADLWFVTAAGTAKLADLEADPHVNLSYYKDRTREWISVSGLARVSRDRQKIHELYASDWKAWFPDEGDPRHGTPDDPRMVLIGVDIHAAVFLDVTKPQPIVLFELAKGWLTGQMPDVGEMHRIEGRGHAAH
jgi:general stress protein 26